MKCPKCGHDNENDMVTCRNCSAILPVAGKVKLELPQVKIIDINMPFLSMVNFLAKLVLAAIPAAIIVAIIMVFAGEFVAAFFRIGH
jgi:uncharacterized membrane protein YvbJ